MLKDVEQRSQSINQNLKFFNGFLLEDKLEVKAKKLKQKKALLTEQSKYFFFTESLHESFK